MIKPIKIGNVNIDNNIFLAPLAAINCPAFRLLCKEYGAGLVYTQMIDVDEFLKNPDEGYNRFIDILDGERPISIQLVGSKPDTLAKATKIIDKYADIIDINLGCIEKDILAKQAGSFLIKHPEQIKRVVDAIISNTNKPVTAKIRIGWDNINAIEVSKILENYGIKAIAVHARTKLQKYTGKADWNVIKSVKENVNIPIIGNGDVKDYKTAESLFKKTNCDAIMIGRATIGNPQIFKDITEKLKENKTEKYNILEKKKSFFRFIELYNLQKRNNITEIKHHAQWFFKNYSNSKLLKEKIEKIDDIYSLKELINKI
jgi:tRNA-dihydrouridine synthase B